MNRFIHRHFPTVMNYRRHKDERGIVFVTVLFVGLLLTFIGLSFADVAIVQFQRTNQNVFISNALLTAEAGIEQSLHAINETESFAGFEETDFYDNDQQGRGTYETTIESGSGPGERVITSTGRAYSKTGQLEKERRVKVTIVSTSSPGYSVQAGAGGLILRGSAAITNSQVYVNGYIELHGAARIGQENAPLDIFVANQNCPNGSNPGATYPQVCTTGQPIRISDWSSVAVIGNVCATGQTQAAFPTSKSPPAQIRGGSGGAGLITGCTAPVAPMPTYDRSAHIASMTTNADPNNIDYNCSQWQSPHGFVRTFPANIRLNGNANWASSCDLTITGNVYITGNLTIGGAARIRIADSVGTTRPVIVVDGTINAGGSGTLIPNSSGTSAHFISYRGVGSCNLNQAGCSGNDLKNSQNQTNINVGGAGSYPGTIFHAYNSKVVIAGSGNLGSAIGQTIDLDGAGTVTFGTALASGENIWTIRSYQYDYD